MKDAERDLRTLFDDLFIAPFASHQWASSRGRAHWVKLEGWQDSLAGPLSSIVNTGGCNYVYARDDWYFSNVKDPQGLRKRLLEWHAGLATGVDRFVPTNQPESTDRAFMQSIVTGMMKLLERACSVEQARWSSSRNTSD